MKLSDFLFQYPTHGLHDGICRVRTFLGKDQQRCAVLTDLGRKNPSASVTNAIEIISESLLRRGFLMEPVTWIEHYEPEGEGPWYHDSFDLVTFPEGSAVWKPVRMEFVCDLLACDSSEFAKTTLQIPRMCIELAQIRRKMDPFLDFPYLPAPDILRRRLEIADRQISKQTLREAVERGAGERELSALLKRDLSLLGEVYAHPAEEYICFSEFPIGDGGRVDFIVLSGRSRMDATLIEIKGAESGIVTQTGYQNFTGKTKEASYQLQQRYGYIFRNYESFRKHLHRMRKKAEEGKIREGCLVGPYGRLLVDPNKDIHLHFAAISGRTLDDLSESRKRHDFELTSTPPILLESWDSWINKLTRE